MARTNTPELDALINFMIYGILSLTGTSLKTQQTGIDHRWKKDVPWMEVTDEGAGMACSLCTVGTLRSVQWEEPYGLTFLATLCHIRLL